MFYEVLMKKEANKLHRATAHLANAISTNPYAITGALGGGVGGAIAAGEGNRTKGALGGAVLGGLAGKAAQEGIARFGPVDPEDEFDSIRNVPRLIKEMRKERIDQINKGLFFPSDALESLASSPSAVKNMAMLTPKTTAAVLGTGLATGAGAGTVMRKRKEKRKKMQKKAMVGALKRGISHVGNALATNPYAVTGAVAGAAGGAAAAGEGNRLKGALGGAALGGLAGKGLQAGVARFDKGDLGNKMRNLKTLRQDTSEAIKGFKKDTKMLGKNSVASDLGTIAKGVYSKQGIGGPQMLGTAAVAGGIAGGGAMRFAKEDAKRQQQNPRPRRSNPLLGVGGYAMGIKR